MVTIMFIDTQDKLRQQNKENKINVRIVKEIDVQKKIALLTTD